MTYPMDAQAPGETLAEYLKRIGREYDAAFRDPQPCADCGGVALFSRQTGWHCLRCFAKRFAS